MASQLSLLILMLLLFNLASIHVTGDQIMLEDGYMVSTVFDGNKLNINPYAVQLRSSDLVVLDSSHSVFYTLPFPISQGNSVMIKRLSGEGRNGYTDGEPGLARFNKPKSFAVDFRGNVYVADQLNHAVRKISNSGVTSTIVGNYSQTGRQDGPGETATFSSDFEVLFVPQICALLISDHGNQLLRQIDLKPEDCAFSPQSGENLKMLQSLTSVLGAVKFWVLGLALSCLLGIVIGIATRPYAIPHVISYINTVGPKVSNKDFISLMDSDINNCVSNNCQVLNFNVVFGFGGDGFMSSSSREAGTCEFPSASVFKSVCTAEEFGLSLEEMKLPRVNSPVS
ncbi:hypothetical protein SADUNF_Sadunf04G0060300 [Salix dunnii]|uniref:NHL repeat-containing protein n=1 Tax=Salix dunnii TaxID=1413687 RepID=A0A835N0H7_9ROSI|nr:hypothetical protein SADUNF_Sadunf04G0060300 [Salix dunnii]